MGIKQGDVGIYTDKIESHDYGIKLFSEVGKTFPLYCTALGKVLLAYGPAAERKRVLSLPMKPFTPKTITDARRLMQQLARVHEQGLRVGFRRDHPRDHLHCRAGIRAAGGHHLRYQHHLSGLSCRRTRH